MQITFEMAFDTQLITLEELNEFQTMIGKTLPEDYRQHMLTYNGGDVEEINNERIICYYGYALRKVPDSDNYQILKL